MQDTTDLSNTNPYPAYTPAPAKPAPTTAQQTLSALTRIETLVGDLRSELGTRLLLVEVSVGALLVGGAFLLGHVWR